MNRNYILKISISPEESILFAELIWKKDDVLIMKNAIYMQNESVVLLSVSIDTSYVNSIVQLSDDEYSKYIKTLEKAPKKNICNDYQNCSCKEIENAMKSDASNDFKLTELNLNGKSEGDTAANELNKDAEINESENVKDGALERKIEDLTIRVTGCCKEESASKQVLIMNESIKVDDRKVRENEKSKDEDRKVDDRKFDDRKVRENEKSKDEDRKVDDRKFDDRKVRENEKSKDEDRKVDDRKVDDKKVRENEKSKDEDRKVDDKKFDDRRVRENGNFDDRKVRENKQSKTEDQKVKENSTKRSPKKDRSLQSNIRNNRSPEITKTSSVKINGSFKSTTVSNWNVKNKEIILKGDKFRMEDEDSWQTKPYYKTADKFKGKYDKKSMARPVSSPSKEESINMNVLNNRGISVTFRSKKYKDLAVLMSAIKKDFAEGKEDQTWGDTSHLSVAEKGKKTFLSGRGKYVNRRYN